MIRFLAWYLSGLFALACLIQLFVTVAPQGRALFAVIQGVCFAGVICFVAVGLFVNRLPATHWLNRSASVRVVLFVFAAVCTVVVLFGTIG